MIFLPDFTKEEGKKLILSKKAKFISLMLISGQIELLKKISEIINLDNSEYYGNFQDKYFY